MNLVPLFEEALEFQDYNGTVLSDGKVAVYYIGRTRLADIYEDVAAEYPAENPRILNNLGMGPVYVNPAFDYEMVVFDTYGSELFSVKKYLASKGEHSTANVVVTPSESIAVSAWTVGDVQVYMPYLTGQLGKVYTGIDPIVVNNVEDKISANHVPLGVQDPLYFVQDDEEGCIIGCSAQTEIPSALSGKWDNAADTVIANSAQWAEGTTYEAGSYVDIDGHTINVTGLQPAGNYQSAGDYVVHDELSSYATQDWVNEQGFLTAHQDLSDYAKTEDLTAYQEKGNYYSASNPSGFINSDAISAMATTGFVAGVSADITAMIPDTSDMATKTWVSSQGYLTAHQSLDGLMSADLLEISDNKITGYNGTAFAGQGGGVTGDFTLVEGNGIQLTDDPIAQTTTISVSGDYATNTQLQSVSADITAMIPTALTGDYLTKESADTLYAPTGNYLTGLPADVVYTADIADMATTGDLTGKQDITGMTAYATVESLTAKQDAGSYLSSTDSANFLLTSDSGNFYPMNENPSGYLTAHQDLSNYATTAQLADKVDSSAIGVKQVGSTDLVSSISGMRLSAMYAANADWASNASKATRDSLGNIITATYISAVPDTYLQNTDLTISDGKITEISGVPLSAGDELPSGMMNESAVEYNAVNEISGYNGSAIAQYGAEKQWLVHDDTLVHASNSAQYALGCNISALQRLMGIDETVLYSGEEPTSSVSLSETWKNFDRLKIYVQNKSMDNGLNMVEVRPLERDGYTPYYNIIAGFSYGLGTNGMIWQNIIGSANDTGLRNCSAFGFQNSWTATSPTVRKNNANDLNCILKVIGVHRISG